MEAITPTPLTPTPEVEEPIEVAVQTEAVLMELATLPPETSGFVQVYVTVRQRAWMRVTVDDKVEFEGRVIPGSAYQFSGENQVEIMTGNGAALQVFYNQQDQGPLSNFGQVVNLVYTREGAQAPTPTITPTQTITPTPSPTPRQTATPQGATSP